MKEQNFLMEGNNTTKVIQDCFKDFPSIAEYRMEQEKVGDWTIQPFKLGEVAGYFTNGSQLGSGIALLKGKTCWMSITPLELESHLIPNALARGTTVIAGLGLGMITMSLLKQQRVRKLIVLEIDQTLIDSFSDLLEGSCRDLWLDSLKSGRLEVIQADCKQPLSPQTLSKVKHCDYLWVDIWSALFSEEAIPITLRLQRQIESKVTDFWGMELEFMRILASKFSKFSEKNLYDSIKTIDLPFSSLKFKGKRKALYGEICFRAAYMSAISAKAVKSEKG